MPLRISALIFALTVKTQFQDEIVLDFGSFDYHWNMKKTNKLYAFTNFWYMNPRP